MRGVGARCRPVPAGSLRGARVKHRGPPAGVGAGNRPHRRRGAGGHARSAVRQPSDGRGHLHAGRRLRRSVGRCAARRASGDRVARAGGDAAHGCPGDHRTDVHSRSAGVVLRAWSPRVVPGRHQRDPLPESRRNRPRRPRHDPCGTGRFGRRGGSNAATHRRIERGGRPGNRCRRGAPPGARHRPVAHGPARPACRRRPRVGRRVGRRATPPRGGAGSPAWRRCFRRTAAAGGRTRCGGDRGCAPGTARCARRYGARPDELAGPWRPGRTAVDHVCRCRPGPHPGLASDRRRRRRGGP